MRAIEERCFAAGLPAIALMESAGRAIAAHVLDGGRIAVVCGKGNNGADGMVAARVLAQQGADVRVILAQKPKSELAVTQEKLLQLAGVKRGDERDIDWADVVVDALLGIGARQPLDGEVAMWVERINRRARKIVALDLPSGICRGFREDQVAVKAHETVSFHAHKIELAMSPARAHAGVLTIADIGIPDALFYADDGYVFDATWAKKHLAVAGTEVHKGTFGHVAIVGGGKGMEGAGELAALAALRTGAGLATAIGSKKARPEIMHAPMTTDVSRFSAACVGPGLGKNPDVLGFLARLNSPAVIDADALNVLAQQTDWPKKLGPGIRVLTPHPLEFARLFKSEIGKVQEDRIGAALRAAKSCGATVVLKGANTVVASPDGHFGVCASGGRELSKGGSGDVLAGMITALLAARVYKGDPFVTAALGTYLHGAAGAHAAAARHKASVLASEIAENIATALAQL
jgi:NAD(P)H-hydrate epimerase